MYCPNCKEKMDMESTKDGGLLCAEYRCPNCDFLATWTRGVRGLTILFNPREETKVDWALETNEFISYAFGFHEIEGGL